MANPVPQPPDTSDLPVSSNLASAISDSGSGLAALATPSEAPPSSSGASSGSLQSAIGGPASYPPSPDQGGPTPTPSVVNNPPQQTVTPQAPLQGLGGRLRGVLMGLATGGVPGAVEGAIAPNLARTHFQQAEAVRQARVTFVNAQAADAVAKATLADHQYQNYDSDHQLEVQKQNLELLRTAQEAGFSVRAVTSLDQGTTANTQSAMDNLNQIKQSDGAVGHMLHLHVGDSMVSLQPRDPTAGLNLVNQTNQSQGKPVIDSNAWQNLSPAVQQGMMLDAINFTNPDGGVVSENSVNTLQNRLGLVKAQPDFLGKDQLVSRLQNAVDLQTDILNRANVRGAQQKAEASKITGAQETENKVAQVNALAGPEARAAGQKAYAEKAAQNKADQEVLGGNGQDAFGYSITPPAGGVKEYNKVKDSFKKDADNLAQTEQTFRQFGSILSDIDAGKDITGAQSVVGLFNAIGISAEPLKGKGFRINSNTVEEHANARGLGQSLYQKFLGLKDGDIITPQQLKDYAQIAANARTDAYVSKYNEARAQGINPNFLLPKGNGQKLDPSTGKIFYQLAGGNKDKARAAAQQNGWTF